MWFAFNNAADNHGLIGCSGCIDKLVSVSGLSRSQWQRITPREYRRYPLEDWRISLQRTNLLWRAHERGELDDADADADDADADADDADADDADEAANDDEQSDDAAAAAAAEHDLHAIRNRLVAVAQENGVDQVIIDRLVASFNDADALRVHL